MKYGNIEWIEGKIDTEYSMTLVPGRMRKEIEEFSRSHSEFIRKKEKEKEKEIESSDYASDSISINVSSSNAMDNSSFLMRSDMSVQPKRKIRKIRLTWKPTRFVQDRSENGSDGNRSRNNSAVVDP